jgi:putrescine aminotransferase
MTAVATSPAGPVDAVDRQVVLDRYSRHVNRTLATLASMINAPVEVRSEGTRIWDEQGESWLDCGGFGVFLLGRRHPRVVEAVRHQLDRHPLASRLFPDACLAEAAATLASVTPGDLDRVFLTNSGAEAVDLGLKIARLNGRNRVVAMHGGFHGKTLGAVSVTGRAQYRDPFEPLLPGVEFIAYGDVDALDRALAFDAARTVVVLEPVQAEGGVILPPGGYLTAVRDRCRRSGALMMVDEIQTGLGRLGHWWGCDAEAVVPDILLAGKILGGGVMPVGAVVTTGELFRPLDDDPLLHSSTFAGNPLAATAVTATIQTIRDEDLVERSRILGARVQAIVADGLHAECPDVVREVRGRGLLVGVEFISGDLSVEFLMALVEQRIMPSHSLNSHNVLRLTPSALLSDEDLGWLEAGVKNAAAGVGAVTRSAADNAIRRSHHA